MEKNNPTIKLGLTSKFLKAQSFSPIRMEILCGGDRPCLKMEDAVEILETQQSLTTLNFLKEHQIYIKNAAWLIKNEDRHLTILVTGTSYIKDAAVKASVLSKEMRESKTAMLCITEAAFSWALELVACQRRLHLLRKHSIDLPEGKEEAMKAEFELIELCKKMKVVCNTRAKQQCKI